MDDEEEDDDEECYEPELEKHTKLNSSGDENFEDEYIDSEDIDDNYEEISSSEEEEEKEKEEEN